MQTATTACSTEAPSPIWADRSFWIVLVFEHQALGLHERPELLAQQVGQMIGGKLDVTSARGTGQRRDVPALPQAYRARGRPAVDR